MTAPQASPLAPASGVGAPDWSVSTAAGVPTWAHLDQARADLAAAADALDGWSARRTDPGHPYVRDGHDALRLLDVAARELSRARAVLVGRLRADEDQRAARVDRLLAASRAARGGEVPGRPDDDPVRDGGGW